MLIFNAALRNVTMTEFGVKCKIWDHLKTCSKTIAKGPCTFRNLIAISDIKLQRVKHCVLRETGQP